MQQTTIFSHPLRALGLCLGLSLGLGAAACAGPDNVAACEDWVAEASCGDTDFSLLVDCTIYEEIDSCDISDYFQCLTDNTVCDEATGVADTLSWTTCASMASCN